MRSGRLPASQVEDDHDALVVAVGDDDKDVLDDVDVGRVRVVASRRRGRVAGRDGDGVSMSDRTARDTTAGVLGERAKTSDGDSGSPASVSVDSTS